MQVVRINIGYSTETRSRPRAFSAVTYKIVPPGTWNSETRRGNRRYRRDEVVFIRTATRSAGRGETGTSGCGGSAGLTRGYIIDTATRCASRHAAFRNLG
jgi:hypothetical protein